MITTPPVSGKPGQAPGELTDRLGHHPRPPPIQARAPVRHPLLRRPGLRPGHLTPPDRLRGNRETARPGQRPHPVDTVNTPDSSEPDSRCTDPASPANASNAADRTAVSSSP